MKNIFLKRQLKSQGASPKDAEELSGLSAELYGLTPNLDPKAKRKIADEIGFKPIRVGYGFRWATGSAFLALITLVIVAQSAKPGSVLYALKRGTEEVRVIVQPGFDKEDLKQRREEEKKQIDDDKSEGHQGQESNEVIKKDDGHSESEDLHKQIENEVQKPEDSKKVEDSEDKTRHVEQKDMPGEDIPKPEDQNTED